MFNEPSNRSWTRVPKHHRLDAELVRRGLVASRTEAQKAIADGLVVVSGVAASKAATMITTDTPIVLTGPPERFVSRGGEKLDGALDRLRLEVRDRRWLDAGAATGGFTDCLLQRGASEVVAVDVGYGQLAWALRNDPRVTVIERVNVRDLTTDVLPWRPEGVVADLSFISLRVVLPALVAVADANADFLLMVKPQFEVGRADVGKGGVVRDPTLWATAVQSVVDRAADEGLGLAGAAASPLPGPAGNREFFVWLRRGATVGSEAIAPIIEPVIEEVAVEERGRMGS